MAKGTRRKKERRGGAGMSFENIFGKIEKCWDCDKEFRAKGHHYKLPNGKIVALCNLHVLSRDPNKIIKVNDFE